MWYRVGADLVVVIHLLFISFVVGGGFPTWRGIWISWAHIPAASYGTLVEFAGFACPRCYSSDKRARPEIFANQWRHARRENLATSTT